MSEPKQEVREYLKNLIKQLVFIKSLDKQLKLISEWESPQRTIALNIGSHFFRLVNYSFKRSIIIELCKLFSIKEDKSIIDFLHYAKEQVGLIEPSRFNPESQTREKTNKDEYLEVIEDHLKLIELKNEIIKNLKGHRDKLLVHSDACYYDDLQKLYKDFPLENTEIDELITSAKVILESHHVYLLESSLEIEVYSTSDVDTILWHIRGFKRVWEDKRATSLYPGLYKLDDYEERLKEHLSKEK